MLTGFLNNMQGYNLYPGQYLLVFNLSSAFLDAHAPYAAAPLHLRLRARPEKQIPALKFHQLAQHSG